MEVEGESGEKSNVRKERKCFRKRRKSNTECRKERKENMEKERGKRVKW